MHFTCAGSGAFWRPDGELVYKEITVGEKAKGVKARRAPPWSNAASC
jgi:hypothetical protein